MAPVSRLLNDTRRGQRSDADAIWALLNLELWHRTFIDGDGVQTLGVPEGRPLHAPAGQPAAGPLHTTDINREGAHAPASAA